VSAGAGSCGGEVCLTCSDEALPWRVVAVDGDLAWVDTGAGREQVSVALVDAAIGDVVLVHAGEAIACPGDEAERSSTVSPGDQAERSSTTCPGTSSVDPGRRSEAELDHGPGSDPG
jgi:hydrogenase expression/formation protein HypC